MSWTRDPTSGVLTHAGTARDFWEALDESGETVTLPATVEVEFHAVEGEEVKLWVRGSGDGQEGGFEVGTDGTDLVINRVDWGDVTNLDSTAHGATTAEPFTIRVRLIGDTIEATILLTSGALVTISATPTEYRNRKAWGFISEMDGATVSFVRITPLTPKIGSVDEVPYVVAGGDLFAAYNSTSWELVAARLFGVSDQVGSTVLNGQVQFVGGGRGWLWNVVERTVEKWVPDAGELPGQTEDGTTEAKIICTYRARICLAGMASMSNVVATSAVGEPLSWDTSEVALGRAVNFGNAADRSTLHIADPVVGLGVLNDNVLVIGCTNSAYTLIGDIGDPSSVQLIPMSLFSGVSGPRAIATAEEGINLIHCPEGLYAVQPGRSPVGISGEVLSAGITFPRADRDRYRVTIIRDASRRGMHIWITGPDSRHFWFDERLGWAGGVGGFFPESYHANVGNPTCAWLWKGVVCFGTTTGKVCRFGGTTDLGQAIACKAAFSIVGEGDGEDFEPENDTILTELFVTLGKSSASATVRYFGGRDAEEAFDSEDRYTLLAGVPVVRHDPPLFYEVRAPWIVAEISGSVSTPIILESMHAASHSDQRIDMAPVAEPPAPPVPCAPAVAEDDDGDGDAPPGPGPGIRPTGLGSAGSGSAVEGSVVER